MSDRLPQAPLRFSDHFAPLAAHYDVVLCDVWGVVHNGDRATAEAGEALAHFRSRGGIVVLITNAPRPNESVRRQLDHFGVRHDAYDDIVSSGDVTRAAIAAQTGQRVFHLGPERDRPIFAGLNLDLTALDQADYVVCSGLFDDETELPGDYRPLLDRMRTRGLFMICANPDVVVERGDRLLYCAGAIADLYAAIGGDVLYAGKPHPPIYERALAQAAVRRGTTAAPGRVLAIGDSIRTDFSGAARCGLDFLFVTSGIHAEELGARHDPDASLLDKLFEGTGGRPRAVMRRLVW